MELLVALDLALHIKYVALSLPFHFHGVGSIGSPGPFAWEFPTDGKGWRGAEFRRQTGLEEPS